MASKVLCCLVYYSKTKVYKWQMGVVCRKTFVFHFWRHSEYFPKCSFNRNNNVELGMCLCLTDKYPSWVSVLCGQEGRPACSPQLEEQEEEKGRGQEAWRCGGICGRRLRLTTLLWVEDRERAHPCATAPNIKHAALCWSMEMARQHFQPRQARSIKGFISSQD